MEEVSLSQEILESITGRNGIVYQLILLLVAYIATIPLRITLGAFIPIVVAHVFLLATSLIARRFSNNREATSFFVGLLLILLLGMALVYLSVFLPAMEALS